MEIIFIPPEKVKRFYVLSEKSMRFFSESG